MANRPAAIDAATHMIERRFAPLDTALYWRAVNYYDSGALATARADIDAARRVRLTNETLTLAGIIEHDQGELPAADRDLRQALSWMSGNCTAAWYVGSVAVKRQAGEDAATYFEAARFCYQNAATQLESKLDRLDRSTTADPVFRDWQRDQWRRDIRTAHTQSAASAVNAASAYLFLGNYEAATRLLDAAGAEPSLASDITKLRHEMAIRRPAEGAGQ
jgi:tetratricopeptide (TPR) repeat protein